MDERRADLAPSAILSGSYGPRVLINGEEVSAVRAPDLNSGLALPDGAGRVVWIPGEAREKQKSGYVDARELKLKVRELAEQLIAGINDPSLRAAVALPVSFVNLDNLSETSSLGRYIAEQLFHEFSLRGFPVREYRIPGNTIATAEGKGEFYLSRALKEAVPVNQDAVVVAGTYYVDSQAIFINARLLRPSNGRVLRTANLVLPANSLTLRMSATFGAASETGRMRIRDYKETVAPTNLSPFDLDEDIH
jgi:TolB-like protein